MDKNLLKNIKVYCCYHELSYKSQYNLIETEYFKPFYTKKILPNSLNNLQEFFNEWVCQNYIYRNNIKSDYIGFCHYRRKEIMSNIIKMDNLNKFDKVCGDFKYNGDLCYFLEKRQNGFLSDELKQFIKLNYNKNSRIYKYFVINYTKNIHWLCNECYFTEWQYFYELQEFLTKFIDYIDNLYNLNYTARNYKKFLEDYWINTDRFKNADHNQDYIMIGKYRIIGFTLELLIGFYFGNLKNEKQLLNYKFYTNKK